MIGKTILILGGGVGGIAAANRLRQRLPSPHRVIVVEKRAKFVFTPSLLWVMTGQRRSGQIIKDLHNLLFPGIEIVHAEIMEIDVEKQKARTETGYLDYDFLVIALGAELAPEKIPGFDVSALTPYDLEGAAGLLNALERFEGGRVAVLVSSTPYKCPAAPYETALLLEDFLRKRGIRDRCQVNIFTPEKLPMGVAGPAMGKAVVGMLADRNIGFHPELTLAEIDPGGKELKFTNHESVPFDLLAGIPPHRAPLAIRTTPLPDESGWIPVDKYTLQTGKENVFAIGDVTVITLSNGMALPKAGVFAEGQGLIVADRIIEKIRGETPRAKFDGLGFCWIETGGRSAGFASGEFYNEPDPDVGLPRTGKVWHWGKILFERYWLGQGMGRTALRFVLNFGGRVLGVPVSLPR